MQSFEKWLKTQSLSVNAIRSINQVCENIVAAKIPFNVFWENYAEPVLLQTFSDSTINEQQIIEAWGWNLKGKPSPYAGRPIGQVANEPPSQEQKSAAYEKKYASEIKDIKTKLINALEDYKQKYLQRHAEKGDKNKYMIVSSLINSIQKSANTWKPTIMHPIAQQLGGKGYTDWDAAMQKHTAAPSAAPSAAPAPEPEPAPEPAAPAEEPEGVRLPKLYAKHLIDLANTKDAALIASESPKILAAATRDKVNKKLLFDLLRKQGVDPKQFGL